MFKGEENALLKAQEYRLWILELPIKLDLMFGFLFPISPVKCEWW